MPASPLYRHACPFCDNIERCFCHGNMDEPELRRLSKGRETWHQCTQGKGHFNGIRLKKWDCIAEVRRR